jgi:hypothetical protein
VDVDILYGITFRAVGAGGGGKKIDFGGKPQR